MRALISKHGVVLIADDQTMNTAFLRSGKVCLKLCQIDVSVTIYDINSVIIVKQNGAVMIETFDIVFLPRSVNGRSCIQIGLLCIVSHKCYIESSLVITDTCGPHSFSVNALAIHKFLSGSAVQSIVHVCCMFPMLQVVGFQNLTTGHKVHGGTYHVISILYTDHIRIRIIHTG